jgi:hypothetical protein
MPALHPHLRYSNLQRLHLALEILYAKTPGWAAQSAHLGQTQNKPREGIALSLPNMVSRPSGRLEKWKRYNKNMMRSRRNA